MRLVSLVAALLLFLASQVAVAEERIALVVGNSNYRNLGRLPNPAADARLISDTLRTIGFDVTLIQDSSQSEMKRAIANFGRKLRAAGGDTVGLFYYAGHGVQSAGINYLIPVGEDIRDEADLEVFSVNASWVLGQMASNSRGTNIVILDACRNNPFESSFRSATRGLARMGAPNGSFVAYATAPGEVAYDGNARNSPYSAALARAMTQPGVPIEQVFKNVRVEVLGATGGRQTPWDSSSLTRNFVFTEKALAVASGPSAEEDALWARVRDSNDPAQLGLYLSLYPDGAWVDEALALREKAGAAGGGGDQQVAAVAPSAPTRSQQPATGAADTISLKIALDYSGVAGCELSSVRKAFTVPLDPDAPPTRVAGSDSNVHGVTARRQGDKIVVRAIFGIGTALEARPIEIELDPSEPGRERVEYSTVKAPNKGYCPSITLYATLIE